MHLYLVSFDQLRQANRAPEWWSEVGLTPLVLLPEHDRLLYRTGNETLIEEGVEAIRYLVGPRDWYAAYWTTNNHARTSFLPWEDDAAWNVFRWNLTQFRQAAGANSCRGLLADWEVYSATPHSSGGQMNPRKAWLNAEASLISRRAAQYREALGSLTVGGYVATGDVPRLPGLRKWIAALGDCLVLDETYTGHSDRRAVKRLGAQCLPGFKTLKAVKAREHAWLYDGGKLLAKA